MSGTPVTYNEFLATVRFRTLPVLSPDGALDWLMQIVSGEGDMGMPVYQGNDGLQGTPGPAALIMGKVANTAALPALANTSADRGKAYWIGGVLWSWTGTAWVPGADLTGPQGAASGIAAAADWKPGSAPVQGAYVRYDGTKFYAQPTFEQAWERTSDMTGANPAANAAGTSSGSIPSDTLCALPWQSTDVAGAFGWTPTGQGATPSRIYMPAAGRLNVLNATCRFGNNQYNSRGLHLRKNGAEVFVGQQLSSAPRGNSPITTVGTTVQSAWQRIPVAANDYIELMAYQDTNGLLDCVAANHGIRLSLELKPS